MSDFRPVPKPPIAAKHPTPLRAINPARRAREFARTYHSAERVAFVKALACIVPRCTRRPSDNAHIVPDGMARKADYDRIVPLCRHHHTRLDTHPEGREGFEGEYYVDLAALAADVAHCWSTSIGATR